MTTRERWIVYPLLMFSLMMGIKTHYFQDTFVLKAEKIECGDLTVRLINGRPARLTAIIPSIPAPATAPPKAEVGSGGTSTGEANSSPKEAGRQSLDEPSTAPALRQNLGDNATGPAEPTDQPTKEPDDPTPQSEESTR